MPFQPISLRVACVALLCSTGCITTAKEPRMSMAEAMANHSDGAGSGGPVEVQVVAKPQARRPVSKYVAPADFLWPVSPVVVNSPFGHRFHPISGSYVFHAGLDLEAFRKQRVVSVFSGRVIYAGRNGAHGNHVEVQHNKRYVTRYSHLDAVRVSVGDWVDRGATVGVAGSTGHSTGVHLHFEVWKDGLPMDPLDVLPDPEGPRLLVESSNSHTP